jgi:NADH:ubiquinone reductase (H+-translocating)
VGANRPKVLIVGAGFGGLWAARALRQSQADLLVLDRNNYHTFFPLLYQVAAAELEPEDIIYPVRSILRQQSNVRFLMGEITGIDPANHLVSIREHSFQYDYLILSIGSKSNYFGVRGAAEYSFPLKTLEQAVVLRNHVLSRFEHAMYEMDGRQRQQALTFAIVGGGPTGVEFTGALAELIRAPLVKDYPNLDFSQVRILLLEATDRLLSGLPERLHAYTLNRFTQMGIEVRLKSMVNQITSGAVILSSGEVIPTETVVWTAGVQGERLPEVWQLPALQNGQLDVLPSLQVRGYPEIYVIGDLAHVEQDGRPLPMIAPVAIQEGEWAARNIQLQIDGKNVQSFRYHEPGMMVTTGRNSAAVQLGRYTFIGFPAWVIWLSVHLFKLIGFRNRLLVLINWAWDYLFFERVVRLILPLPGKDQ